MINKEIAKIFKDFGVDYNEGLLVLLAIYHKINKPFPDYIPTTLILRVLSLGIVDLNTDNTTTWRVPLFEEQITHFEWVVDYRNAFKKRNPERAGTLSSCMSRMKEFFANNPHVRVEHVNGAVGMYFRSVKDPQYLITSHKFIYEGSGKTRNSPLEEWLEKYYEAHAESNYLTSESKTMQ